MDISRRNLLGGACGAFFGGRAAAQGTFSEPLGVQLYTVRDLLPTRARETLKAIAEIGYTEVETFSGDAPRFEAYFKEFGLKTPSGHFETPLFTGNWAAWEVQFPNGRPKGYTLEAAIGIAKKMGMKYMVVPYLMPAERHGRDSFLRFAEQMNRAGEQVRSAGLTLCYHNHGFEFSGLGSERPFDVLMKNFEPELVYWELDVFWCSLAGYDPAKLISDYPDRIALLHLKDKPKGAKRQTDERMVKPEIFKEVGGGDLDFRAILRAAEVAGVAHYFVEQDECPGNPLASLRASYTHLRKLKV